MNVLLTAVSFLTAVPVRARLAEADIGKSVRYFPVVGLLIGVGLAGLDVVLTRVLPGPVVNLLLVLALVLLTNGFHLDGLADTVDGLGGGETQEEALRIMKDSGIGAFGAAALFFDLILKYLLLGYLPAGIKLASLLVFPLISRWAMSVTLITQKSPRGKSGLAGWYRGPTTYVDLLISTIFMLVVTTPLMGFRVIPVLVAVVSAALILAFYMKSRLGGMTGDNHGAVNEVVELVVLFTLVMLKNV
ncbi:MAG: adenosylcobinamide-GDP ribazoletransferase [Actinobacteria bacterium]|nr:adenosylcobinamide-GDP ribazoletransferase [Actinomycetota bacterium]